MQRLVQQGYEVSSILADFFGHDLDEIAFLMSLSDRENPRGRIVLPLIQFSGVHQSAKRGFGFAGGLHGGLNIFQQGLSLARIGFYFEDLQKGFLGQTVIAGFCINAAEIQVRVGHAWIEFQSLLVRRDRHGRHFQPALSEAEVVPCIGTSSIALDGPPQHLGRPAKILLPIQCGPEIDPACCVHGKTLSHLFESLLGCREVLCCKAGDPQQEQRVFRYGFVFLQILQELHGVCEAAGFDELAGLLQKVVRRGVGIHGSTPKLVTGVSQKCDPCQNGVAASEGEIAWVGGNHRIGAVVVNSLPVFAASSAKAVKHWSQRNSLPGLMRIVNSKKPAFRGTSDLSRLANVKQGKKARRGSHLFKPQIRR